MKTIITQLICNIQQDQEASGDTNTHAEDVDGREKFVLPDVAKGKFKVILKHGLIIKVPPMVKR